MNIALPAIVFFLLALPGFLFRSRLKRVEQTSIDHSPFGRVVVESILWAFGLHILWLTLGWLIYREVFELGTLLRLLSSGHEEQSAAMERIALDQTGVARYFITLYLAAILIPPAVRYTITWLRLDRIGSPLSGVFRFHQAPWYYLLTGADFGQRSDVDYIQVAAVIDVAGQPVLYTGVLDDFYFGPDGQLDRLVLEAVARRPFSRDRSETPAEGADRFYSVDGDYFVIRYQEAITLNIQYIKFETDAGGASLPAA